MSGLGPFQLIDFSSHMCVFLLGNFHWMADIINFTLLNAVYFCSPKNILELCSGTQLSYLKTIWSFWAFKWDQNRAQFKANYFWILLRQDFSLYYVQCFMNHSTVFIIWLVGMGPIISGHVWMLGTLSDPLYGSFLGLR